MAKNEEIEKSGSQEAAESKQENRAKAMLEKTEGAKMLAEQHPSKLPGGKIESLGEPPEKSAQKIKELEEKLIRLQADFQNHIKRSERQQAESADIVRAGLLSELLPVVDQLELALQYEKSESEFKKGIEMVYKNLMALLKKVGVKEMESYEKFDPYLHEAAKIENGEDGKILSIIQKGYMFKGKVLRHAKVVLGRKVGKEDK